MGNSLTNPLGNNLTVHTDATKYRIRIHRTRMRERGNLLWEGR